MTDLITRLEQATEGSMDFNEDIALASGLWRAWVSKYRRWNFDGPDGAHFSWPEPLPKYSSETGEEIEIPDHPWNGWGWDAGLPDFSGSLDAALTLVPGRWQWLWRVEALSSVNRYGALLSFFPTTGEENKENIIAKASTPALALCIAALRARARNVP